MKIGVLVLTIGMVFISYSLLAQKKWAKQLDKIDVLYRQGNYEKAKALTDKNLKKVEKKPGVQSHIYILFKTKEARNYLGQKQLWLFLKSIEEAEILNREVNVRNTYNYIADGLDICELYLDYGNYKKAVAYLEKIEAKIPRLAQPNTEFEAKIIMFKSRALIGVGRYNDALAFIGEHINDYRQNLRTKEAYIDERGRLKTRLLSDDEIFKIYSDYAHMLQLVCEAYWKQGDFRAADDEFEETLGWIAGQSILGKTSLSYLEVSYMKWQMSKELGLNDRELRKECERLLRAAQSNLYSRHNLVVEIYYELLKLYLDTNDDRYDFSLGQFQVLVYENYPANSAYRVKMEMLKVYRENYLYSDQEMKDRITSVSKKYPDPPNEIRVFGFWV